jgi:hypothetical protein
MPNPRGHLKWSERSIIAVVVVHERLTSVCSQCVQQAPSVEEARSTHTKERADAIEENSVTEETARFGVLERSAPNYATYFVSLYGRRITSLLYLFCLLPLLLFISCRILQPLPNML